MRKHLSGKRHGYPLLIGLAAIVLAFMGLSLAVTATGTARFAVAMGYCAEVGYAVFISHALGAYGRQALEVHLRSKVTEVARPPGLRPARWASVRALIIRLTARCSSGLPAAPSMI